MNSQNYIMQQRMFFTTYNKTTMEHIPIWCRIRGSIILAICWLSFVIWAWFTFFAMSPPLNSPLMPPIFFTTAANFVYCEIRSFTSFSVTPAPWATRITRPDCFVNSFAPSLLSSSVWTQKNSSTCNIH